jgi:uncharacterized protein YceH (UPF0502 family)
MEPSVSEPENSTPALPCLLSPVGARVLGCLFEKEFATPDQYPLTLNALTNACNQRNNREPVMALSDGDVSAGVDELRAQKLAVQVVGAEARVPKYKHKLEQVLEVTPAARAVLCELLLRGPQTAAALRGNAQRLVRLPEGEEFDSLLEGLSRHAAGELVRKLPRQPGQKEARWTQLLTGEPAAPSETEAPPRSVVSGPVADLERRVGELEALVQMLMTEVDSLRSGVKSDNLPATTQTT